MWYDLRELLGVLGFFASAILLLSLMVAAGVTGVDYLNCSGLQTGTGIPTRWSWGCYAQVNGRWVPSKYVFGDAHELRIKDGAPERTTGAQP